MTTKQKITPVPKITMNKLKSGIAVFIPDITSISNFERENNENELDYNRTFE